MASEFWLTDRRWEAIAPVLPSNQPGARRVNDRRVLSGIVHFLRGGGLAGLPALLRPCDHHLQPLSSLVAAQHLD